MVKPDERPKNKTAVTFVFCLFFLHLAALPAAAESTADWRPMYDTVMLWVNFFILAYLLVRFLREPFKAFLKNQKEEIAGEIEDAEKRYEQLKGVVAETEKSIEESAERFERIKERIIEEGERTKQQIIDNARLQGQKMVESERKKAESYILRARKIFLEDMVDEATKYAQNRLPSEITDSDQNKMLDEYVSKVSRMVG